MPSSPPLLIVPEPIRLRSFLVNLADAAFGVHYRGAGLLITVVLVVARHRDVSAAFKLPRRSELRLLAPSSEPPSVSARCRLDRRRCCSGWLLVPASPPIAARTAAPRAARRNRPLVVSSYQLLRRCRASVLAPPALLPVFRLSIAYLVKKHNHRNYGSLHQPPISCTRTLSKN